MLIQYTFVLFFPKLPFIETLRIQNVIADDAGEYSCLAANTAGYAREDVILTISHLGKI